MSKKVNEKATTAITAEELKGLFEKYSNVSLRKLAHSTEVSYPVILKASKAPVPGEAYNPDITNWRAVAEVLNRKEKDLTALDWEALNAPAGSGATLVKDTEAFQVGTKVYLRRNNETPYEIVYRTDTNVVLLLEGTTEPHVWSWDTFIFNGPVFEPRAVTAKAKTKAKAKAEAEAKAAQ